MPEIKKTRVYFEGDDDKAFLEPLCKAALLPNSWELAVRSRQDHPGKDGLIRQLSPWISPINGAGKHAVVFIDLDELSVVERADWFRTNLTQTLSAFAEGIQVSDGSSNGRVHSWNVGGNGSHGLVVLIPMGCPNLELLTATYGIDRFAMDDWVLQLALNQSVYESVSDLNQVPFKTAVAKLSEVADLFRKNGLEVRKGKTYVQILRTLAAIAPSTATIVGRIVQKSITTLGRDQFREFLKPMLDDVAAAEQILAASITGG